MTIKELLHDVNVLKISGNMDADINKLCFDSRQACDGTMFFAVKGTATDGHDFIEDVKDKGAKAIVCERMPDNLSDDVAICLSNRRANPWDMLHRTFTASLRNG